MNTSFPKPSLKLLITGGKGQLANALLHHSMSRKHQLILLTHAELDINNRASIEEAILHHRPDVIINAAAYTQVDQAESNIDLAMRTNYEGAKQLGIACNAHHIPLFHLSTDYIFDGQQNQPYHEEHAPNPLSIYGRSKWLGEEAIRQTGCQFIILRVSAIFSEFGHNFVKTILRLAKEKNSLKIVADQFTCPTYAGDIAAVIFFLINNMQHKQQILHFCGSPAVSWHQFAQAILQEANLHLTVEAIPTLQYPAPAKRPMYSVLDCQTINKYYDVLPADWIIGLRQSVKQLTSADQ